MLRRRYGKGRKNPDGQIFLEYVLVIGTIVLIMLAMSTLIKRGAQGMIKVVADQIGDQVNAEQQFDSGFLKSSNATVDATSSKHKSESDGVTTYSYDDKVDSESAAEMDLGFTEKN